MAVSSKPAVFFAYCRVSSEEQAVSGLGLEAQEQRIRAYALAYGGQVAQVFADPGLSGSLPVAKRPGLRALLQRLERAPRGQATLVVARLDRLSRNVRVLLGLEEELRRKGIALVSLAESFDSSTPAGRAFLAVVASFGQYEAELAAERTFVAMRTAVTPSGARVGGPAPIGYALAESGAFVRVAQEANLVRRLFTVFLMTRSYSVTAQALNLAGHRTRANNQWSHVTVGDVVRNVETYCGTRVWARTSRKNGARDESDWLRVPNAHPAIIDPATAAQVIAVLERRDRRRQARRAAALAEEDAA